MKDAFVIKALAQFTAARTFTQIGLADTFEHAMAVGIADGRKFQIHSMSGFLVAEYDPHVGIDKHRQGP